MTNCLFCQIYDLAVSPPKLIEGNIKAAVVYEDGNGVAFLDIHPKAPGHTIVIPKRHVSKIADLPDSELGMFFLVVKKTAVILEKSLFPDGLTIGINQGQASGQEVAHLHVHILPRFLKDGGGSFQSVVDNPPNESFEEIAEKIKKAKIFLEAI